MNELSINDWRVAVFDSELNTTAKIVGLAIARYWRPDKLCYPSISTLMIDCSIKSKHTVIEAIKTLKNAGLIKIKKGELKYLSSMQNFYELVGVNDSADDGASNSAVNGASNGATKGASNGAINAPEIREVREIREYNKKNITKKVSYSADFENWWSEYPRKVSKLDAEKCFSKILSDKKATIAELMEGVKRYSWHCRCEKTEAQYIKHPSTWLNQGCWCDVYNDRPTDEELASWKFKPDNPETETDWEFWRIANEGETNDVQ
jgi:hypothetical protein